MAATTSSEEGTISASDQVTNGPSTETDATETTLTSDISTGTDVDVSATPGDTSAEASVTTTDTETTPSSNVDLDCDPDSVGDGACNANNNNAFCEYDKGDCCACTCQISTFPCGTGQFDCIDPDAGCDASTMNEVVPGQPVEGDDAITSMADDETDDTSGSIATVACGHSSLATVVLSAGFAVGAVLGRAGMW